MIFFVILAYIAAVLAAASVAGGILWLIWRGYTAWRDHQRAIGYEYGAADCTAPAPVLDIVATEHLGQVTGSAAFGEALLRGELRKPAARTEAKA